MILPNSVLLRKSLKTIKRSIPIIKFNDIHKRSNFIKSGLLLLIALFKVITIKVPNTTNHIK